jgi:nucleotide-binding universal stress UspA family protein
MINKILVTTDLSSNSKAGIRFAIQLASQSRASLIFYHVIEIPKPTRWSDKKYETFTEEQILEAKGRLNPFVKGVYKRSGIQPGDLECVVHVGSPVDRIIMDYAVKRKVDFICMSTRGAGMIRRLMGTHTSSVLTHSTIPVLAIPKNYRATPIKQILYSTDLNDLNRELKMVKRFADLTKSKISVVHYDYLYQLKETRSKLNKVALRHQATGVKFHFGKLNMENSLQVHLKKSIQKLKPSVVVLFTKQNRDWYERLFLSSKSADVSFDTKNPLLIIPKK